MTEGDIIRIGGVEYDICDSIDYDSKVIGIRPKRKQTGWVCRMRGQCCGPCYKMNPSGGSNPQPEERCLRTGRTIVPDWQPFYGKVVE